MCLGKVVNIGKCSSFFRVDVGFLSVVEDAQQLALWNPLLRQVGVFAFDLFSSKNLFDTLDSLALKIFLDFLVNEGDHLAISDNKFGSICHNT